MKNKDIVNILKKELKKKPKKVPKLKPPDEEELWVENFIQMTGLNPLLLRDDHES
jgi:hypothetical protein